MNRTRPVPDSRESARMTPWSAAVCAVILSAVTVGVVASRFGWGLDRTDEGQYLTLLADPETGRSSVFLFGYVLHPLFTLLGGDILGLRIVGLAVSVLISAALGYTVARLLPIDRPATLATAAAVGAFGIGPLSFFPATPSYNTLAYWGCCLWAIGLAHTVLRRRSLLGPAVLGVGGVVAFSGKATTGAALAALTLAVALAIAATTPPPRGRRLVCAAASVIGGTVVSLVALMLLVGHGPGWFVDFYSAGARNVGLLQGHDDLVRLDPVVWSALYTAPALLGTLTFALVLAASRLRPIVPVHLPHDSRRTSPIRAALIAAACLLGLAAIGLAAARAFTWPPPQPANPTAMLTWWWLPVWIVVALAAAPRRSHPAPAHTTRADRLILATALAVLPLAYVVGTNGNYWIAQARAGGFWLVAGVVLLSTRPAQRAALTAATTLLALILAVSNLAHAYRYDSPAASRHEPTQVAVVSPEGARLRVTAEDAATSAQLAVIADEHHLEGVPILDVTGASPGYIRQLGARPVGSSWLLGGYPGSVDAALDALSNDDPGILETAWLLDAPDSPRRIDGILSRLGLTRADYRVVATFRHHLGYDVQILRPVGR